MEGNDGMSFGLGMRIGKWRLEFWNGNEKLQRMSRAAYLLCNVMFSYLVAHAVLNIPRVCARSTISCERKCII